MFKKKKNNKKQHNNVTRVRFRRQDIHHGRIRRTDLLELGGGVQRGHERVEAAAGHAEQTQRRVLHRVPRAVVRAGRFQRVVPDVRLREVRPGHAPLVACR